MRHALIVLTITLVSACERPQQGTANQSPDGRADSLATVADLEKEYAHEGRLHDEVALRVQTIPVSYGVTLDVRAVRISITTNDSTHTFYYVRYGTSGAYSAQLAASMGEWNVPEHEIPSLIAGIDSLIARSGRASGPGISRFLVYRTAGETQISVVDMPGGQRTAMISGSGGGGGIPLSLNQLPALRAATLATRDSIGVLRKK